MRSAVNHSSLEELNAPGATPSADKAVSTEPICRSMSAAFGPGEIREAILKPDRDLDPRRGAATVVLGNSTTIMGIPRNEDNFSLQLQTSDGTFHLLNKAKIKSITYLGATGMPIDYASSLTPTELDDLVRFLINAARSENRNENPRISPVFEDGDEE
jgi:cytochrome c oxidase cbb3-type subunit 3